MRTLESRLATMEKAISELSDERGPCLCSGTRVFWPDGIQGGPDFCSKCGRPKISIRVVYE